MTHGGAVGGLVNVAVDRVLLELWRPQSCNCRWPFFEFSVSVQIRSFSLLLFLQDKISKRFYITDL